MEIQLAILYPQLHNYWINKNGINAIYEKAKLESNELKNLILKIKSKEIDGINITVPFKKEIISYCDKLSLESQSTQSVNTINLDNDKIVGHNTDINGFELGVNDTNYTVRGKKF